MPTAAMEDQYGIALRIFGAEASADLPLPPISDGFRVDRDGADTERLRYTALTDQRPDTIDATLAEVAAHPGTPTIIAAVGETLAPGLIEHAGALNGIIRCATPDQLLAPLSHIVSVTGLIGLDVSDTLSLLRGRAGTIWEGPNHGAASVVRKEAATAISFAFSPCIPSLPALEAVMASIDPEPETFTIHLNASLTDPDRIQMLLMRSE